VKTAELVGRLRSAFGILAYGSLLFDPGVEIEPLIVERIETLTPFPVEYGRLSATRGGAPTLVPHPRGSPVKAHVLVLAERKETGVPLRLKKVYDLLWRRETRREGPGSEYPGGRGENAVCIRDLTEFCGLAHVLYTDFNPEGKIAEPDPTSLARAAIESVRRAAPGKDGLRYLIDVRKAGVKTRLTPAYVDEILSRTGARELEEACERLKLSRERD
jgi:hypothetical protein